MRKFYCGQVCVCLCVCGGGGGRGEEGRGAFGGILAPYQSFLVFAGEHPYMCTLS